MGELEPILAKTLEALKLARSGVDFFTSRFPADQTMHPANAASLAEIDEAIAAAEAALAKE